MTSTRRKDNDMKVKVVLGFVVLSAALAIADYGSKDHAAPRKALNCSATATERFQEPGPTVELSGSSSDVISGVIGSWQFVVTKVSGDYLVLDIFNRKDPEQGAKSLHQVNASPTANLTMKIDGYFYELNCLVK